MRRPSTNIPSLQSVMWDLVAEEEGRPPEECEMMTWGMGQVEIY